MVDNSEEFWNNEYWKNVINENKTDFMKDSWMAKYLNHITNVENKKAIDLGCGIGQDTKYLLDKGFDVVSCDFSERALNKLKELIPNSKTMQIDIKEKLPFEDNSIGLINAKNFYYENGRYRRLFNKEQFDILTKEWNIIILNENVTVRIGRKKALWEFILRK